MSEQTKSFFWQKSNFLDKLGDILKKQFQNKTKQKKKQQKQKKQPKNLKRSIDKLKKLNYAKVRNYTT